MSGEKLDEIEITPEMIEAGAQILDLDTCLNLVEGYARFPDVLAEIYRKMDRARSET